LVIGDSVIIANAAVIQQCYVWIAAVYRSMHALTTNRAKLIHSYYAVSHP